MKRVYLQGDAPARAMGEDLASWYVPNGDGGMVPFSAFSATRWTMGSPVLERYNGMSAFEIVGEPAEGVSSGTAMDAIEKIIKQLPEGIGFGQGLVSLKLSAATSAVTLYKVLGGGDLERSAAAAL